MRKIWQWLLTAIVGMTFILISPPLLSQAREITQATGLDEASAVIQDADGNILSHDAVLPESSEYTVNYKWAIPNGVLVFSGDTMTVHVPTNVKIPADDRFTMTNTSSGKSIGTFFIAAGSHTGTVTLNSTFTFYPLNRQGYIHLAVTGTEPDAPDPIPDVPIAMSKTAAWADSTNQTHINWGIDIAANGHVLTSPVITDTLSVNQTYVPGSAKLTDEYGNVVSVEPTISGSVLTFNINGSFVNQLKLTYQTTTNEATGTAVFKNQADYTDSAGNSGSASATIERIDSTPDGSDENDTPTTTPEQPDTTEPEQPGTTEPEQPSTTEPEQPSTTEPEQPGTTEPEAPSTTEPEQPGTTEPEQPGTTEPEQPGTTEPEQPGTTEPDQPSTTEPEQPGTTEPETPGTTEPEQPSTTEPEQPDTTEPEQPSTTEPEQPGTTEPEQPSTTEPEQPGTTEPEQPSTTEPEAPSTTEPEQPGMTEPELPSTTEPEQPGTTEPENDQPSGPAQSGTDGTEGGADELAPAVPGGTTSGTSVAPTASAEHPGQAGGATGTLPLTPVLGSGTSSQAPAPASGIQPTLPVNATSALPAPTGQTGSTPATLPQTNEQAAKSLVGLGLAVLGLAVAGCLIRRRRS